MTFLSQELTNIWKLLIEVFPSLDFFPPRIKELSPEFNFLQF